MVSMDIISALMVSNFSSLAKPSPKKIFAGLLNLI